MNHSAQGSGGFGKLAAAKRPRPMSDINVTPLVDVVLVLLVIFMLATPLMASRLALELPSAQTPAASAPAEPVAEPEVFVSLSVDAQGQVYWDDQPIDTDTLRQRLQAAAERNPDTELRLRADAAVPYGRMVQLMALAQTAGFSRMGFVTDPAASAPPAPPQPPARAR